ncbi:nitrate reductase molybdenum cofactor assembly chaperone [Massilia sp. LC238]|uniref:nitrate reductase molybdenum cofactor assembly chaperone n=1 Tax=Massilia sp. LC238 TaxID=1502852 RepID=UPI0004E3EA78|nr:nitrate reductase molybdenum cofactor assembly chaperone [Massilia sp. LC238]KFC74939.1 Nitrate reductase, delta subunit [Massilia sp. LC238]
MQHYQILSALLTYPEPELVAALPELEAGLPVPMRARVASLLAHLAENDMITLQQEYVQTFDRTPTHSLHLFEHIHGESRDRGQAMVDLMEEYKKHGLEMCPDELPDYVPLFLEFLSQLQDDGAAGRLLGDAVHVLAHIGRKLAANGSVYAGVFDVLESLSPVQAEELSEPPIKDMDEALETFGPGADGVEPLLKPAANGTQPINFYPQGAHRQARAAA